MNKNRLYVGIDPALVMGVAFWNPATQVARVVELTHNPVEQLLSIFRATLEYPEYRASDLVFVMEELHNFRNAKTTRSLLERSGYIKYTLINSGYPVHEVAPDVARRFLGTNSKQGTFDAMLPCFTGVHLTNNHTDALAVALYQAHKEGQELDWYRVVISNLELEREADAVT